MEMDTFVRKPFLVEAVQITEDNIAEVAKLIGKLKYNEETGEPYIKVNPKVIPTPNPFNVHPGYWMTKVGKQIRCYSQRIFDQQFTESTPEIQKWVDFMTGVEEDVVQEEDSIVDESLLKGETVASNSG